MESDLVAPHPWYILQKLPILGFALPARITDAEMADFLEARLRNVKAITTPWAAVVDISNLVVSAAPRRKMFAAAEQELTEPHRQYLLGAAIVVSSAFNRGVVTALFWIAPPIYPYKLVATVEEGIAWAVTRLKAAKVVADNFVAPSVPSSPRTK